MGQPIGKRVCSFFVFWSFAMNIILFHFITKVILFATVDALYEAEYHSFWQEQEYELLADWN